MKLKSNQNNGSSNIMDELKKMEMQRSPKGKTVFRFNNLEKSIGKKTTRKGTQMEVNYLLFEGTFVIYNNKKTYPGKHILELPTKSCLQKIGSIILENNLDLSKPITIEFIVSKSYKKYDISLIT